MGIATAQWRLSIGCWQATCKFQLPDANTNNLSTTSAIFFALVLAVLLVVGGVEMNPGPNTQDCCKLCEINIRTLKEREHALQLKDEDVLVMLQQKQVLCDVREQDLQRRMTLLQRREGALAKREASLAKREVAVGQREKVLTKKGKRSGTPDGGVDIVRSLLEKKMISKSGLLEWAVLSGYMSIARFLVIEAKLDVNAKDSRGRSVLFLAVEHGLLSAVKLLLPLSTDYVKKDRTGNLAFHLAVSKGHIDVVKYLISDNPALSRKKDGKDRSALHFAAENGHLEIVKLLVEEARCDVEVRDEYGWTSLHCAAIDGHLDVVKYLIQKNPAHVEVRDKYNLTPRDYAEQNGHSDVVEYLVQETLLQMDI